MKFYHGTKTELNIGDYLEKDRDGYTEYDEALSIERAFEVFKPENMISRKEALYVVGNTDDIDNVGAYDDFVYEVFVDDCEKSDLSWYTELQLEMGDYYELDELTPKAILIIKNYWNGIPSDNPVWEYRTYGFSVNKLIENNTLEDKPNKLVKPQKI